MTRRQATTFRNALLKGGFVLVGHGTTHGITSTRLDLLGVVSVVLTTENDRTCGAHFHWRRSVAGSLTFEPVFTNDRERRTYQARKRAHLNTLAGMPFRAQVREAERRAWRDITEARKK